MNDWQFYRDMPVYAANGSRLGHLEEVGHGMDYLHVRQGNLLIRDWYVPFDAIAAVDTRRVQLDVNVEDLRRDRRNVPPHEYLERQGMTPGYEYTSPADMPHYATEPGAKNETTV